MKHYFGLKSNFELSFFGPVHILLILLTLVLITTHYQILVLLLYVRQRRLNIIALALNAKKTIKTNTLNILVHL